MGQPFSCPERGADQLAGPSEKDEALPESKGYWEEVAKYWSEQWPLALANTMEWYEFAVYSNMEPYISQTFFGNSNTISWMVYSISFAVRSLGGAVFGTIADRYGRRPAILTTLSMMCCATLGQGLTPAVPYLGPIWLITCRVVQGLSAGGEIGSVPVFLAEQTQSRILTMSGMLTMTGGQIGFASSSLVALILLSSLGDDQMVSWGWRIPFALAVIPGAGTIWAAYSMPESNAFEEMQHDSSHEEWSASHQADRIKEHWVQMTLSVAGLTGYFSVAYLAGVYLQEWLVTYCGTSTVTAFWVIFAGQSLCIPAMLPFACFGDAYGVGKLNALSSTIGLVTAIPMYAVLYASPTSTAVLITSGVILSAAVQGSIMVAYPFAASLFPTEIRGTCFSISWNIACLVGGLAPAICSSTSIPLFPAYYTAFFCGISLVATTVALSMHQKHTESGEGHRVSYFSDLY